MPARIDWPDVERRLVRDPETGCRNWTGYIEPSGYERITFQQRSMRLHRLVWEHHNGPIPTGLSVLHRLECHNRACAELSHLYLGTHQQNMRDMVANGTSLQGDRAPGSKLTWDDVAAMREMSAAGVSQRSLAAMFGCDQSHVSRVVRGKFWRVQPSA